MADPKKEFPVRAFRSPAEWERWLATHHATAEGRRAKSVWSKVNREKVLALVRSGRMRAGGQAAMEAAKSDGRWDAAYESSKTSAAPADFLTALRADKKAAAFYKTLNRANTYAIEWRIHAAKRPETRAKRVAALVATLADGKKPH